MTHLQIRLYRDSFNTPWGFRLQGGKDLGQTLSVQRVFSNSPAEGELQRGDLILAIGGRDSNELTHKQALDLIKHGGGQIQLVIQRPAPGQITSPVIKPQRPRAPALQLSPVYPTPSGPARDGGHKPQGAPPVNPCYNPNFFQHYSPPSHNSPRWAVQTLEPKKVSKLSRLGGGGVDFGVDYGMKYGTVPRRRHSTQVSGSLPHLQSAGGNPARVASLSRLGGGGYDFGADYCTLPRKTWRQKSQPPSQPVSYGFQPKKINLSSFGGGAASYGTDYSSGYRPSVTQPMHVHTGPKSPGYGAEMLNKVQETLDNISLSPRTPDYGYQAPTFPGSPPGGGQYIPTAVRLDMEREREQRRQQQIRDNPPYVPTAVRIDQQLAAQGKSISPRSSGPASAPWSKQQQQQDDDVQDGPAWKSTLKHTSVKPWDADLDYVPVQYQASPAAAYQPGLSAPQAAPYNPVPAPQGAEDGPKVVHLQYNSPMELYSKQNIHETYSGQTKAMAAGGALSPGGTQSGGAGTKPGDRDWSQSALCRMIQEDEHGRGQRRPAGYQQQYRPPPPHTAPKPQFHSFQQSFSPSVDEFGTSEF